MARQDKEINFFFPCRKISVKVYLGIIKVDSSLEGQSLELHLLFPSRHDSK